MSADLPTPDPVVTVSIVVPVRNEAENIVPLIDEITAALDGRWDYEIVYVNDGSTDATAARLAAVIAMTRLVLLAHHPSDVMAGAVIGVVGAIGVRHWFAARRVGFVIGTKGEIAPL